MAKARQAVRLESGNHFLSCLDQDQIGALRIEHTSENWSAQVKIMDPWTVQASEFPREGCSTDKFRFVLNYP
jgi:hypothetical protein